VTAEREARQTILDPTERRIDLCRVLFASGYTIVARKRSGIRLWMLQRRRKPRGGHPSAGIDWVSVAFAKAKRWRASFFNGSAKPLDENRTLLDPEERRG